MQFCATFNALVVEIKYHEKHRTSRSMLEAPKYMRDLEKKRRGAIHMCSSRERNRTRNRPTSRLNSRSHSFCSLIRVMNSKLGANPFLKGLLCAPLREVM